MNKEIHWKAGLMALLMLCFNSLASAQFDVNVAELSYLDKQYMAGQRGSLVELTEQNFGTSFNGRKDYDLALLQRLLDEGLVRNNQTRELQAMGIIMGDLLAEELGLHWVVYEDKLGRSRALRFEETDHYLFPMTMISRRREVNNETPVVEIYQRAVDSISPALNERPFQ